MNIRFYRDPGTDQPHITDVDENEVADVLEGPGEEGL
jgi:hypothetical protein